MDIRKKQAEELAAFDEQQKLEREKFIKKQEKDIERDELLRKERCEFEKFKKDLIDELMSNGFSMPNAEIIFTKAWTDGHSCGYEEVKSYAYEYADMVEKIMKPTAYLMFGIPGAGKSTWIANNLDEDIPVVSRDIIRSQIGITSSVDQKAVGSKSQENVVTRLEYEQIDSLAAAKKSFVIDDTNTSKYRSEMVNHLRAIGMKVVAVRLNTPLDECIRRRKEQIPEKVMRDIASRVQDLNYWDYDILIDVPYEQKHECELW